MSKSLIFDMDGILFQTDRILELSLEDAFNILRSYWSLKKHPFEGAFLKE
nr:hypothetical protein [Bacillus sp. V5-8f]